MNTRLIVGIVGALLATGCQSERFVTVTNPVPNEGNDPAPKLRLPLAVVKPACRAALRKQVQDFLQWDVSLDTAVILETSDRTIYAIECDFGDMTGTLPRAIVDLRHLEYEGVADIRRYLTEHGIDQEQRELVAGWRAPQ